MEKNYKEMLKGIDELSEEINNYLAKFKDEKGKQPNPIQVGLMIQKYCNQFISYANR